MNDSPLTMVAMSGGVDSSVTALLLTERGERVAGMFMKNWEEDDRHGACPAEQDAEDARRVAEQLGITLHTRNFSAEYWDGVFENFIAEYRAGRTPNPDILCNREIKFKTFLEHAEDLGAGTIATGHYARTDQHDGRYRLLRGRDPGKDQSYFLYTLGQRQLARTRFPVGELHKHEVRKRARAAGLDVAGKKDSTGICFIGERDFRGFLAQYVDTDPGPIRTDDGREIGEHQGLAFYTLGQRQGLGIGGVRGFPDAPWYVLHKSQDDNALYVGQDHDHPWLMSRRLVALAPSWVAGEPPTDRDGLSAQVRYRQPAQACRLLNRDSGQLELEFEQPQRAVTAGQSVVLYAGDECLGGAVIERCDAPVPDRTEVAA